MEDEARATGGRRATSQSLYCHNDSIFFSALATSCRWQSRSLIDIYCGFKPCEDLEAEHKRSNSSDEALQRAAEITSHPPVPCHSPPTRHPTPPKFPEFGSTNAQQLRLIPISCLYRWVHALQRRISGIDGSVDRTEQRDTHDNSPGQNEAEINGNGTRVNDPGEALRRAVGTNRPIPVPNTRGRTQRASLPRHIVRVPISGPLTQAEDGTQVRGRFGNRTSGHGIGSRSLNIHPLAVREIDKACAREETK